MLSYRRHFSNGLSFNLFPQSLLLSQFSPGLVALIAVSVLTCATISNDEPPAPLPSNSSTPQVANVQLSSCPNSSALGILCSCGSGKPSSEGHQPPDHQSSSFNLIDVWAGISSFTDAFQAIPNVVIRSHFWIENDPTAVSSLEHNYPDSTGSHDFFDYFWNSWRPPDSQPTVVVAGPSCCHLSVAGKRLRQWDPRSSQGLETAKLAVHFKATILVIENVVQLLDEDSQHGLLSEINSFMVSNGYNPMQCIRLQDSQLGGCTARERVFALWELADFAALLGPIPTVFPRSQPSNIRSILSPIEDVRHLILPGAFEAVPSHGTCSRPIMAGSFYFGGIDCPWLPGCSFTLPRIPKYDKHGYSPSKVWRLLKFDGECVQVFDDVKRRPQFRWIHRSNLRKYNRVAVKWPVLHIDSVSKAVRSSNFPPNDLILDTRFSPAVVRPFSCSEKWRLQRLSETKLAHLDSLVQDGTICPDDVTARAGNSIPSTMVDTVALVVASRISLYQELTRCIKKGEYLWMDPPSKIQCADIVATVLLIVTSTAPFSFLLSDGSNVPCALQAATPEQSLSLATRWATELGAVSAADVCFPLHKPCGNSVIRAIICPQLLAFTPATQSSAAWTPMESLWDSNLASLFTLAIQRVQSHTVNTTRSPTDWLSGKVSGIAAVSSLPNATTHSAGWDDAVDACHEVESELRSVLSADNSIHALYLQSWADIVTPVDTSDIAPHLKEALILPAEWCEFASPDPHQPIESQYAPLPAKPSAKRRPAPLGWLSAIVTRRQAQASHIVDAFVQQLTGWLAGNSQRPDTQAIPGSWLEHWIYEAPHEFHSEPGWANPIDVSKPFETHMNLNFLMPLIKDYSDQELVSFVELGVRYKADLEPLILLQPHLVSFLPVQDKFLKEADKFVQRGWTEVHSRLPCVPFRSAACGSTCRPLEPDRPRCTNDAGAPRCTCYSDGVQVLALNDAIDMGSLPLPQEIKPRSIDLLTGIRIMHEAAALLQMQLLMATDDFASFFNQLRLAPEEMHKTGVMHPPRKGQLSAQFAIDKVLGFGIRMASNVAQRFANLIRHVFCREMDRLEEDSIQQLRSASTEFDQWCIHRLQVERRGIQTKLQFAQNRLVAANESNDKLSIHWAEQALQKASAAVGSEKVRLFFFLVYTDDPVWITVGPDRMARSLKLWHWLTAGANFMMAIPEKRSLGTAGRWLGINFLAQLGISAVPAQKILRACMSIDAARSQSMSFSDYRRLVGFLEHIRDVLFLRGNTMYGLYAPHSNQLEPADPVAAPHMSTRQVELIYKQMAAWKDRLLQGAGCSISHIDAFLSGGPIPTSRFLHSTWLTIFSDAAKEGTSSPGLGGWIKGYYWFISLTPWHLQLHITHLEALAAIINVIMADLLLGGHESLPLNLTVCEETDALATAYMLIKGRAHSPMMQFIHTQALNVPQFVGMLPHLSVSHITGLANLASDAASRGKFEALHSLARQLGVIAVEVQVPNAALELLHNAVRELEKLQEKCPYAEPLLDIHRDGDVPKHPGPKVQFVGSRGRPQMLSSCKPIASTVSQHKPVCSFKAQRAPRSAFTKPFSTANDLAMELAKDESPFALCPGDFPGLLKACENAFSTADKGYSLRTSSQDLNHWRIWEEYCVSMGTTPWRTDHQASSGSDQLARLREVVLMSNALLYFIRTRKPRSNSDKTIKPASAVGILLGMQRVLKRNHIDVVPLRSLNLTVKGLMRDYVATNGPSSLVPKRREPMTNGLIQSLVSLPAGTPLGSQGQLKWDDLQGKCTKLAICMAAVTGFRSVELFQSNSESYFLQLANISWRIQGVDITSPVTDAQLLSLSPGDFMVVTPVPSKADQFNVAWGALPIYVAFKDTNRNAARAARDVLLHSPSRSGPLLRGNDGKPLTQTFMKARLHQMLKTLLPPAQLRHYTWHSFRSGLACMLLAANCKPATIQAMLRWRSEESLRAYARLNPSTYSSLLDRAERSCVASVQTSNLPLTEQFDLFLSLQQISDAL